MIHYTTAYPLLFLSASEISATPKIAFPDKWITSIFAGHFSQPHKLGFHCTQTSVRALLCDTETPPFRHRNSRIRHTNPGPKNTEWRTQPTTNRVSRTVEPASELPLQGRTCMWPMSTTPTATTCHRRKYKWSENTANFTSKVKNLIISPRDFTIQKSSEKIATAKRNYLHWFEREWFPIQCVFI